MSLQVEFGFRSDDNGLRTGGRSWMVVAPSSNGCAVGGFGRHADAEIAKRVLETLPIDFSLPLAEVREQWMACGGRKVIEKEVFSALQW